MKKRRLGKSGLVVAELCMGTMTFGEQADEKTAFAVLARADERGIGFFDTAEMYPVPPTAAKAGLTEKIVGRRLKIAGPAHGWLPSPVRDGFATLDRHPIRLAIEGSPGRLQTDYIGLYQTHWPDHGFGYEETLRALDDLVEDGKIRVAGCSNETCWGVRKSLRTAERLGARRFEPVQNHSNPVTEDGLRRL